MQLINVHAAKTNLSQLLQLVAGGHEVILGKSGVPVAKIVPYHKKKAQKRVFGKLKGKIWISKDFNDEDPQINELFS